MTQLPTRARRSQGVGLITAIFLLVVLGGLAVALVSVFASSQHASSLDEQGARAYQAARAGLEWGLYQRSVNSSSDCAGTPKTFRLPAGTTLSGFVVTVSCEKTVGPPSNNPAILLERWLIRATACTASTITPCNNVSKGADYVERMLEVQI